MNITYLIRVEAEELPEVAEALGRHIEGLADEAENTRIDSDDRMVFTERMKLTGRVLRRVRVHHQS